MEPKKAELEREANLVMMSNEVISRQRYVVGGMELGLSDSGP